MRSPPPQSQHRGNQKSSRYRSRDPHCPARIRTLPRFIFQTPSKPKIGGRCIEYESKYPRSAQENTEKTNPDHGAIALSLCPINSPRRVGLPTLQNSLIKMPRAQPVTDPMGNFQKLRAVTNIQRPLFWQRAVDHIRDPPRTRAHHHNLGAQVDSFRD